jgi:hypothetical protein
MINPLVRPDQTDQENLLELFNQQLGEDGYRIVKTESKFGNIRYRPEGLVPSTVEALDELRNLSDLLGSDHLQNELTRIFSGIQSDPESAIGTAKELLETMSKTILKGGKYHSRMMKTYTNSSIWRWTNLILLLEYRMTLKQKRYSEK